MIYLGLDGAGKTHLVETWRGYTSRYTIIIAMLMSYDRDTALGARARRAEAPSEPTMGFKIQQLEVKQFKLELWEVGGTVRRRM